MKEEKEMKYCTITSVQSHQVVRANSPDLELHITKLTRSYTKTAPADTQTR